MPRSPQSNHPDVMGRSRSSRSKRCTNFSRKARGRRCLGERWIFCGRAGKFRFPKGRVNRVGTGAAATAGPAGSAIRFQARRFLAINGYLARQAPPRGFMEIGQSALASVGHAKVGGGIVGLATAMTLSRQCPTARILLLEKEQTPSLHQSGRNSGVIHSGNLLQTGQFQGPIRSGRCEFDGRVLPRARHSARSLRQGHRRHPRKGTTWTGKPVSTRPAKRLAG